MPFSDIKGQDRPIEMIKQQLSRGQAFSGGYLFCGPEGIGKKLAAYALAKAVNCQETGLKPCEKCPSCLKINNFGHPDVHFLDDSDSGSIKIEAIRQLQRDISLRAYEAKQKVFIVDNAHNLTPEAANAFLKTLEEPPGDSLIILISSKPALLFKTIISRCRILKFYPLSREELKKVLVDNHGLGVDLAHYLSFFSEGRIGKALALKDSGILEKKNMIIDECVGRSIPASFDGAGSLRLEAREYLGTLAAWFRDIYLLKTGAKQEALINFDRRQELSKSCQLYSFDELNEVAKCISDSFMYVQQNINAKLVLANLECLIKK